MNLNPYLPKIIIWTIVVIAAFFLVRTIIRTFQKRLDEKIELNIQFSNEKLSLNNEILFLDSIIKHQVETINSLTEASKSFEKKYNVYKELKDIPAINDTSGLYDNLTEFSSD